LSNPAGTAYRGIGLYLPSVGGDVETVERYPLDLWLRGELDDSVYRAVFEIPSGVARLVNIVRLVDGGAKNDVP
jgi:hypothetical protein